MLYAGADLVTLPMRPGSVHSCGSSPFVRGSLLLPYTRSSSPRRVYCSSGASLACICAIR